MKKYPHNQILLILESNKTKGLEKEKEGKISDSTFVVITVACAIIIFTIFLQVQPLSSSSNCGQLFSQGKDIFFRYVYE